MKLRKKHYVATILIMIGFLLVCFLFTDNGMLLFLAFLLLWLLLIIYTIKPLSRFHYWLIFRKSPSESQLKKFIIYGDLVAFPLLGLYGFLNIKYPTTPLNYFLRTVILGFLLIAIYVIYKYVKKEKIYLVKRKKIPSGVLDIKLAEETKDTQKDQTNHSERKLEPGTK